MVLTAGGEGFTPPSVEDFWQPLVGHGAWALTRPGILLVLSTALIIIVLLAATRRLQVVPSRGQAVLEAVYNLPRNSIGRDLLGQANFRPYIPVLASLFFILLVNNLLGIVPLIQYPPTARIGIPVAMMLFVYVLYLGIGFRRRGFLGYFRSLVPAGLPVAIVPLMFFLECITFFFTRPVTLALRLMGNMFAGHMLLLLMAMGGEYMLLHGGLALKIMSVGPFVMFFVLTVFEILIEFLQAYIFTLLAAFYIADSLAEAH
ncbi:MAG: F0F1 ATP synthase subunit A [Actinomycetes bacterium]